jgi:hypothetical protein
MPKTKPSARRCSISSLPKPYLAGTDAGMPKRTWQHALEVVTETKRGANKEPWKRVAKDRALSLLWSKVIVETEAELVLKVLRIGTVSTNVYLRRLYNFCVDMNWLLWPIVWRTPSWTAGTADPRLELPAVQIFSTTSRER